VTIRTKDVEDFELTPGLAEALTGSLDASYLEYFTAASSGRSTKESEKRIAAVPEDKRYLTRVLDSLDTAFADFDSETVKLDLPHMQNRRRLAHQTPAFWCLRSRRDVFFRPRTTESILSCAMPFYHRVYGLGELQFITTCTHRERHLVNCRAWNSAEPTAENSICTTLKRTEVSYLKQTEVS
jgi:hypothetical protein